MCSRTFKCQYARLASGMLLSWDFVAFIRAIVGLLEAEGFKRLLSRQGTGAATAATAGGSWAGAGKVQHQVHMVGGAGAEGEEEEATALFQTQRRRNSGSCTQPRSEVATISVCYGEASKPITGRRRCIFGSWHLKTAHTSDHCDPWRCTALRWGQPAVQIFTCKQNKRQYDRCAQRL